MFSLPYSFACNALQTETQVKLPEITLVLSGVAIGYTHIGVLKVLEEEIPGNLIVDTSKNSRGIFIRSDPMFLNLIMQTGYLSLQASVCIFNDSI